MGDDRSERKLEQRRHATSRAEHVQRADEIDMNATHLDHREEKNLPYLKLNIVESEICKS